MRRIRPYQIFTALDSTPADRVANVKIPYRRDLKLLETFLLITALRLVNAKRIFEFGTFFGSTTLNLALNSPEDARVFTLDLGADDVGSLQQHPSDAPLTQMHFEQQTLEFEDTAVNHKITRFRGDSKTFDFSRWEGAIDMIFVDGGHDYATVESDTRNALRMLRGGTPACIFWHDYGHPEYAENTAFLDTLSRTLDIFHVEDTILCGWFNESAGFVAG